MQSLRQYDDLVELKTELATVVEALDILHDFIDSVFGAKYHEFCGNLYQSQGSSRGSSSSPREALRDLRWKHCKNDSKEDFMRRSSSSSSSASQVFTQSSGTNIDEGNGLLKQTPSPNFGMIETPEMIDVDVKLEVDREEEEDVPDFLEDVDPFYGFGETGAGSSYSSNFAYEGESDLKYTSAYQISPGTPSHTTSHSSYNNCNNPKSNAPMGCPSPRKNLSPARSVQPPGLIPIGSSDPSQESSSYFNPQPTSKETTENNYNSSESSDLDWHPSTPTPSKKSKADGKKKRKPANKKGKQVPGGFATPKPPASVPLHLRFSLQKSKSAEVHEEGPFKCSMCPASYKQEDSLRSHQKYKHNPSRVQCTCHLCGKSMVDKYRLQRHLRLHTGEKPFECQYCGQSFYRKDYHTKHLQRKHGIGITSSSADSPSTPTSTSSPKSQKKPKLSPPASASSTSTTTSNSSDSQRSGSHEVLRSPMTPPATPAIPNNEPLTFNYFHSPNANPSTSNLLSSSLMTMTSLTFDDLISADL